MNKRCLEFLHTIRAALPLCLSFNENSMKAEYEKTDVIGKRMHINRFLGIHLMYQYFGPATTFADLERYIVNNIPDFSVASALDAILKSTPDGRHVMLLIDDMFAGFEKRMWVTSDALSVLLDVRPRLHMVATTTDDSELYDPDSPFLDPKTAPQRRYPYTPLPLSILSDTAAWNLVRLKYTRKTLQTVGMKDDADAADADAAAAAPKNAPAAAAAAVAAVAAVAACTWCRVPELARMISNVAGSPGLLEALVEQLCSHFKAFEGTAAPDLKSFLADFSDAIKANIIDVRQSFTSRPDAFMHSIQSALLDRPCPDVFVQHGIEFSWLVATNDYRSAKFPPILLECVGVYSDCVNSASNNGLSQIIRSFRNFAAQGFDGQFVHFLLFRVFCLSLGFISLELGFSATKRRMPLYRVLLPNQSPWPEPAKPQPPPNCTAIEKVLWLHKTGFAKPKVLCRRMDILLAHDIQLKEIDGKKENLGPCDSWQVGHFYDVRAANANASARKTKADRGLPLYPFDGILALQVGKKGTFIPHGCPIDTVLVCVCFHPGSTPGRSRLSPLANQRVTRSQIIKSKAAADAAKKAAEAKAAKPLSRKAKRMAKKSAAKNDNIDDNNYDYEYEGDSGEGAPPSGSPCSSCSSLSSPPSTAAQAEASSLDDGDSKIMTNADVAKQLRLVFENQQFGADLKTKFENDRFCFLMAGWTEAAKDLGSPSVMWGEEYLAKAKATGDANLVEERKKEIELFDQFMDKEALLFMHKSDHSIQDFFSESFAHYPQMAMSDTPINVAEVIDLLNDQPRSKRKQAFACVCV